MSIVNDKELGDFKVKPSMNLHKVNSSHPQYVYRKLFPQGDRYVELTSGGETANIVFNIPAEPINLGESYLEYDYQVADQGANAFAVLFKDTDGEFLNVKYRDTGTMEIVNYQMMNQANHVLKRLLTSKDQLEMGENLDGSMVPTNAPLSDVKCKRFDNTTCSVPYKEPMHLEWSPIGTGANGYSINRKKRVYLKHLCPYSWFGQAKDQLLPIETYLDINVIGNRIGFKCTSATDPNTGVAFLANLNAGGGSHCFKMNNIVLNLCLETNDLNIQGMKLQISKGLTIPIDWVSVDQQAVNSATAWSYKLPLVPAKHGKNIKKIIYVPMHSFPTAAEANRMYDHSNVTRNGASANNGSKISAYQTFLDSLPLQRDVMYASGTADSGQSDNFERNRSILKNTTYYNKDMYNFNLFHCDQFDYPEFNHNPEGHIYTDGYIINKDVSYVVEVTTGDATDGGAGIHLNNTSIVLGQKLLVVDAKSFAVLVGSASNPTKPAATSEK